MRDRCDDLAAALNARVDDTAEGAAAFLGRTTALATYPTSASSVYALTLVLVDGPEAEGASVSYTNDQDVVRFAANLGSRIPPLGTLIVVHAVGGRLVFRFDG